MPGRIILTVSALVLLLLGGALMFAPDELAVWTGTATSSNGALGLQLFGGALLGFAILNWMSRGNRIGGIYARPIALGNLLLSVTVALSLGKAATAGIAVPQSAAGCVIFSLLGAAFAWLAFMHDPIPR